MLEPKQVAQAYARWIADGEPEFQAMMSPDLADHVIGQRGPQTWDMVWGWIEASFRVRRGCCSTTGPRRASAPVTRSSRPLQFFDQVLG